MHRAFETSALPARHAAPRDAKGIRHGSKPPVNSGGISMSHAVLPTLRSGLATIAFVGALAGCSEGPTIPDHLRIAGADPQRGQALIHSYGCGTCHRIDGVRGARGTVGPPLDNFAQRSVVAGILPNTPRVLVSWLLDPPAIEPRTAMPAVGLDEAQARHIAAYLYTLGSAGAQVYPPDPPLDLARGGGTALQTLRRAVASDSVNPPLPPAR
jgi:mono/diheme cytochrome c family protein